MKISGISVGDQVRTPADTTHCIFLPTFTMEGNVKLQPDAGVPAARHSGWKPLLSLAGLGSPALRLGGPDVSEVCKSPD